MNLPFVLARRALVASCALFVLEACSGTSEPVNPPTAALLKIVGGAGQAGVVGTALDAPINVLAVDSKGNPVAGAAVAFAANAGGSAVPAQVVSDASGRASTRWTLGTVAADAESLTVSVAAPATGTTIVQPVVVTALAIAGPATALVAAPTSATGRIGDAFATPVSVTMKDAYGNRARAAAVSISARLQPADNDSLIGPSSLRTDADGVASFSGLAIGGKTGALTLVLESAGVSSASVSLAMSAGAAQRVDLQNATPVQAIIAAPGPPLNAKVADGWGNPVPSVAVSFSIDGVGSIGQATTGADGIATLASWTVPAIGSYQLSVTIPGGISAPKVPLQSRAGPPASLVSVASNPQTGVVNTDVSLSVVAFDAGGNPAPNAHLDWSLVGGSSGQATTGATGVAAFAVRLPQKAGANQVIVRASPTVAITINLRGTAGPIAKITALAATMDVPAGTTASIGFLVSDQFANPVPGYSLEGTYTTSVLQSVTPTFAPTDATGIARFTVKAGNLAGNDLVVGNVSPGPIIVNSATTVAYVTASRGTLFGSTLPCNFPSGGGSLDSPAIVNAANGRPAVNIPVTYTLSAGNGSLYDLHGTLGLTAASPTDANGVSSIGWALPSTAGTYHMTITTPAGYDAQSPWVMTCTVAP